MYFAAGFFIAAVVMIVVQAIVPATDRIIPLPSNGTTMAGWALLALVMLFGVYTSLASVLLLAFIFGYAQQTVTRFIDRKVADIAETERS